VQQVYLKLVEAYETFQKIQVKKRAFIYPLAALQSKNQNGSVRDLRRKEQRCRLNESAWPAVNGGKLTQIDNPTLKMSA